MKVYPNTAKDKAKIIFTLANAGKCKITFMDITGRLLSVTEVDAVKGHNETSVDVSRFAGGTYLISLIHGGEVKTIKMVKAH